MAKYFIAYRKLEDWDGPEFEKLPPPTPLRRVIREQVIPGRFGLQDVFIRHYHWHIKKDVVNLVTYTHQELKRHEVRDLANRALEAAKIDMSDLI